MIETKDFLKDYPNMAIMPSKGSDMVLKGVFKFSATPKGMRTIIDSYQILIVVPDDFPRAIPTVTETGRKIPRDGKHHVNPDGSLCMGSPLRLLQKLHPRPNLVGFAESCLVPFLYGVSYKLQTGEDFPFGELDHGNPGIIDDYMVLFGLNTQAQVMWTLNLIGMKRRIANKKVCPCKCNSRLGKCSFRYKINRFRNMAPRSWFKKQVLQLQARN